MPTETVHRAAARGISADSIVHPLRAPNPDITTTIATSAPTHEAPVMFVAAVANGAVEEASSALGTVPNTVTRERR
jgi:hypothetical protein